MPHALDAFIANVSYRNPGFGDIQWCSRIYPLITQYKDHADSGQWTTQGRPSDERFSTFHDKNIVKTSSPIITIV
jgi:hypothetical protein